MYESLSDYYRREVEKQYEAGAEPGMTVEPAFPEETAKKSESVHGHGSDLHQPFFRGRLGQKEFL